MANIAIVYEQETDSWFIDREVQHIFKTVNAILRNWRLAMQV